MGNQYQIEIDDINFSQTFTDNSYEVKTLHEQHKVFKQSVINKANAANFEFTIPVFSENDSDIVIDLLVDYDSNILLNTFDLYISTQQDTFKIETCVVTNGNFLIEKLKPLKVTVQGEGSKLSRIGDNSYVIPGTIIPRSATTTYSTLQNLSVTMDSVALNSVTSLSIELQNEISWTKYDTIHDSLAVTNTSNSMYPINFTLESRSLAGSITSYIDDVNYIDTQEWLLQVPLAISYSNL